MKKYCIKCGKEVETTLKSRNEEYDVKGTKVKIKSKIYFCNECNTELWDDDVEDTNLLNAFNIYRKLKGLLRPEEIKRIRKKYELSQKSFAKILGLGEKTITRYENGSLQDLAQNNLILLMDNPNSFNVLWQKNKKLLSIEEQKNTTCLLNELLRTDSIVVDVQYNKMQTNFSKQIVYSTSYYKPNINKYYTLCPEQ